MEKAIESKTGTCRLCSVEKELTFEHVPPRSAHNKTTRYVDVSFDQFMAKNPLQDGKMNGKVLQGGIGFESFCKKCNSFLGSKYVPAYLKWVRGGVQVLNSGDKYKAGEIYEYAVREQRPLLVLKQIVSMFLAMNDHWFAAGHPDLVNFVNNPELNDLNPRYRVFCYLNTGPEVRYCNFAVILHGPQLEHLPCAEIAFPPFGYVLTIDFGEQLPDHCEITHFKNLPAGPICNVNLRIHCFRTAGPFPLNYGRS